jgi:hypothetical protein
MEVSGQIHVPTALARGKSPWYLLDMWLVDPRAGLDAVENRKIFSLPGIELRPSTP